MRRFLPKALGVLIVLLVVVFAGGYHYLRRSLPQIDGTIRVPGLSAPVDIVRDADAIPHIFATTKRDALFGLGYAHAQDRLWQMELQRRIGFGRLSEVLGAAALPQDRFLRTVGFGRAANSAWQSTPDWAKEQINAYVAGVNAFVFQFIVGKRTVGLRAGADAPMAARTVGAVSLISWFAVLYFGRMLPFLGGAF